MEAAIELIEYFQQKEKFSYVFYNGTWYNAYKPFKTLFYEN